MTSTKHTRKNWRGGFTAILVGLAVVSAPWDSQGADCGSSHAASAKAAATQGPDLVDVAVAAGSFKNLVAAVQAAGLVETLKGEGPFTIFAPTDEAFAKLPEGTLDALLQPQNRDKLTAILTYHVVAGKVPAATAVKLEQAATLNGQRASLQFDGATLRVSSAQVVATDIEASNGVIHVIDRVMLPADKNLLDTARAAGAFTTLLAAVGASGLSEALEGPGPFTVFAPTDEAFAALPAGTVERLLEAKNRDRLVELLKYHVVPGRLYSDQAVTAGRATTLQDGAVRVAIQDGVARINEAKILKTDIETSNGVIHVIDRVLLPTESMSQSTSSCLQAAMN